ncbi:MAG: CHAT domain-containing protein, partial [Caldilineaceae bacterium]|nr:CHAT domain-containing protein [Caldilineaceae bacterium]
LEAAIAAVRRHAPDFMPDPSFASIQQALSTGTAASRAAAGVYLLTNPAGGLALLVHAEDATGAGVTPVDLPGLTDDALNDLLRDWFAAYGAYLSARTKDARDVARNAWHAQLDATTARLWDLAMGPIAAALQTRFGPTDTLPPGQVPVVTLIPTGLLALLPLHAAWMTAGPATGTDSRPVAGRAGEGGERSRHYFLDAFAVRYAPSATSLGHSLGRTGDPAPVARLLAVDEPWPVRAGPLPNSSREVAAIADLFAEPTVRAKAAATRDAVLAALPGQQVAHFSCHGANDWDDPLATGLLMAHNDLLTVRDLLAANLPGARLATLSACETGLVGGRLPDEVVMLPSALAQAGYAGVAASLWSVADISTAMLMVRFYQFWRTDGLAPVDALRAAQRWLRDTTNQEKSDYFEQFVPITGERMSDSVAVEFFTAALVQGGANARTFEHPYWWSAFYLTGA